jgi:hypothetical protein
MLIVAGMDVSAVDELGQDATHKPVRRRKAQAVSSGYAHASPIILPRQ